MLLKNIGARLITINTPEPKASSYNLIPFGDAVDIPDDRLGIAKSFVESFIESGELIEVPAEKKRAKE